MVESNNDEERLARIEHMVERLQREAAINVLSPKIAPMLSRLRAAANQLNASNGRRT
jgi:hypothetical protein